MQENMALHLLNSEDLRSACRQRLESCELWLRALIHDTLLREFGENYTDTAKIGDLSVFQSKIKERIQSYQNENPSQYPRPVDTLTFEHLGSIIGRDDNYNKFFRASLESEFIFSSKHVKHIVSILAGHRNALYHANSPTLSLHAVEQILCYGNDIIESIKAHYSKMSAQDKFPAPTFTRYSDSLGNVKYLNEIQNHFSLTTKPLFLGDTVRFEVEVDSSYPPDEYTITWRIKGEPVANGYVCELELKNNHVGQKFGLQVDLTSKKDWHRMGGNLDALLTLNYEVLPMPHI